VYKIELPKKVVKQLDKVPDKTYPAISTAIQKLKEISRPAG